MRRRWAVIVPTVLAFLLVGIFVNVVSPKYQGEAQVILENQETVFTRPDQTGVAGDAAAQLDAEAVGSQVQLLTSRDLAMRVINDLGLRNNPEFAGKSGGGIGSIIRSFLGTPKEQSQDSDDARIVQSFLDRLTAFSPTKTRVISIQFQSKSPELAALVPNKLAEIYIAEQAAAKRTNAKNAADALGAQIADLRVKLANADAEREKYRTENGLLTGSNNLTITGQQLADINTELSRARTSQADAQAKASMIRTLIHQGKAADVPDVVNDGLVQRIAGQRVTAQSQLDLEQRTLLPGHPRIKELAAQVAGLDAALKAAAKQAISTLENQAKIAGQRVANLEVVLTQQKKAASVSNADEVRLRSLDRISDAYKGQLESSTTKYQEAIARETSTATPADARIIARAIEPLEPVFPKKIPFIAFGTIAAFVISAGLVVSGELLSAPVSPPDDFTSDPRTGRRAPPSPGAPRAERVHVSIPEPARETARLGEDEPAATRRAAFNPREASMAELRRELAFRTEDQAGPDGGAVGSKWIGRVAGLNLNSLGEGLRAFSRSAAESRVPATHGALDTRDAVAEPAAHTEPARPSQGRDDRQDGSMTSTMPVTASIRAIVDRIVSAHVPGRGLHIVGASLASGASPAESLISLSRVLSHRGRSIIVDLNATPANLAGLVGPGGDATRIIQGLAGLSDLLSGDASFAEVIHRDHESRLQFIPVGSKDADFRDFDLILDALSETYDFITLLAPAFPHSEIAMVMAPYADFVVLAGAEDPGARAVSRLESELVEAGAYEVLVIGRVAKAQAAVRKPDVA